MRLQGVFYRAHDPRWSWSPLSGEGAAIHGGRWNPKGLQALYLSAEINIAINEMRHGFKARLEPFTMCSYDIDCDDIVDLTSVDERDRHNVSIDGMKCAWFALNKAGETPPTWTIAQELMTKGFAGMLVPSFAVDASADDTNLVLWNWGPDLPHKVDVYDPSGRLPKNMLSWS